jgi:hypothetical protein
MKRGRPPFEPKVAVCLWVLIEAYREPVKANSRSSSIRHACERLRNELKKICGVEISMERLRTIHRSTTDRIQGDTQVRQIAIRMLATLTAWRRGLIAKGHEVYRRELVALLLWTLKST